MNQDEGQFFVHREPIWRERADFIINAPLAEPGEFEQLWCRQVGDDSFEICCIPFFVYDMALGDIVRTETRAGRQWIVAEVAEPSGRFVFRTFFEADRHQNRDPTGEALTALGALLEWSSASLLAVDARDERHAREIASYLFEQMNRGRLVYETGKSG